MTQEPPIDDPLDKAEPETQASIDMSCKEIIGTWIGKSQKTRLTGTVTLNEETFDVNEKWGWWLEKTDPLEIQIWIENDNCFAKVNNLDRVHASFENGSLVLIQENMGLRFEGSSVQPGRLEGTFKWHNFLADSGAMIYGDWWASKTE